MVFILPTITQASEDACSLPVDPIGTMDSTHPTLPSGPGFDLFWNIVPVLAKFNYFSDLNPSPTKDLNRVKVGLNSYFYDNSSVKYWLFLKGHGVDQKLNYNIAMLFLFCNRQGLLYLLWFFSYFKDIVKLIISL